jgi:two-component system, OmpR family, sensor histidine kinase SenX3
VELVGAYDLPAAFLHESRTRGRVQRSVQEIRVAGDSITVLLEAHDAAILCLGLAGMRITRRRNAIVLSITLGACLVALAITLNVGWIIINWRSFILLVVGIPFFLLLIAGLVLNTIFLVREVKRNERHDSFLNAVTHELKTPITSIRLYLETLQRHQVPDSKRQEFYDIMLSDSERLLATVEQVLKAGEVGQRARNQVRLRLQFEDVVRDCIRTTLQRYHQEESTIRFIVDPDAEQLSVMGNPEDLRTAVLNLLDNAVKYSPEGPQLEVHLALDGDAWMMLTVSDHGLGIAAPHLKRIFKRFYRVPARNVFRIQGTGLGLFLVRSIARQHGGDVVAESEGEGRGTTIRLQLPRALSDTRKEALQ